MTVGCPPVCKKKHVITIPAPKTTTISSLASRLSLSYGKFVRRSLEAHNPHRREPEGDP